MLVLVCDHGMLDAFTIAAGDERSSSSRSRGRSIRQGVMRRDLWNGVSYVIKNPCFKDYDSDKHVMYLAKTINGEEQLHPLVDGKKVIITESSVRRDLQLADEEGVDCLPNSTTFEQLALMGV
ncbi:hypothetical protein Tco_0702929 [Tanacetum coccineum]|uniref:Uncharacterized protein n=1 Tax=Tanacetum coccineum TaxID=301880 RepID=A0ABQ4XYX8_9ASTR